MQHWRGEVQEGTRRVAGHSASEAALEEAAVMQLHHTHGKRESMQMVVIVV
jgi:hypothetical protein